MRTLFLDDMIDRHTRFRMSYGGGDVTYVHTADEAKKALDGERFDVVFLDHDLSDDHYMTFGDGSAETYSPGTGMDVVDYITAMPPEKRPRQAVIHSCNTSRAPEMVARLKDARISGKACRLPVSVQVSRTG